MTNITNEWQEAEALHKLRIIAPLLEMDSDTAAKLKLREELAMKYEKSIRTLYRYEEAYRTKGFSGLKPVKRKGQTSSKLPSNFDELLQEAIQLKREVPKRSVRQIIRILELEGRVEHGKLKRSTLEKHLYKAGFGVKQMAMYNEARESSSKRFCKPNRMMLVQGDIKYGPKLPIGKNGAKVQTYLSSALDDHSRFALASRFYDSQEESIVEDTFHRVINRHGRFDVCYFDNGSQYVAKQLNTSLAKLGITVRRAPVRSGKSKGKIEKFHQVVDSFIRECKLKKISTLDELNRLWEIFLETEYQNKPHEGIAEYYESYGITIPEGGISPQQEFNRDSRALTYMDALVVSEAFKHHELRKVDRGACISFRGRKYETKPSLIGFTVEISYDPGNDEILTVSYKGMETFTVQPLKITSFCDKSPVLPESMQQAAPKTSRLLDALEKEYDTSHRQLANAISFASYMNGGADNV